MTTSKKPLIQSGWIRVCVFIVVLIFLYTVYGIVWNLADFIAADPGMNSGSGLPDQSSFYYGFLIQAAISVAAVILCRKIIDRQPINTVGFSFPSYKPDAIAGFSLAIVLLGTGALILVLNRNLQWVDLYFDPLTLTLNFFLMALIAFSEELVFRGYILSNLMSSFNRWLALGISAFIFTLFHIQNPGIHFIAVLNLFTGGVLLGLNYVYTRNLWFAVLFHFAWNFFQGPVLGFKVSGLEPSSVLVQDLKGNRFLTGGEFGFEGSVLQTILMIILIIVLIVVYEKDPLRKPLL